MSPILVVWTLNEGRVRPQQVVMIGFGKSIITRCANKVRVSQVTNSFWEPNLLRKSYSLIIYFSTFW